jgi:hypothetical protein
MVNKFPSSRLHRLCPINGMLSFPATARRARQLPIRHPCSHETLIHLNLLQPACARTTVFQNIRVGRIISKAPSTMRHFCLELCDSRVQFVAQILQMRVDFAAMSPPGIQMFIHVSVVYRQRKHAVHVALVKTLVQHVHSSCTDGSLL